MNLDIPDFVVIGALKSGTTGLYSALATHPEINMCLVKEPNFYNVSGNLKGSWELGVDWYRDLYSIKAGLKGEASTSYSRFPASLGVARRLHLASPQVKVIYLIRNPVDRAISHYFHNVLAGSEKRLIKDALESSMTGYILTSMYFVQLQQYLLFFPREQINILISERMWKDPQNTLGRLCRFLGIASKEWDKDFKKQNATIFRILAYADREPLNEAQKALWKAVKEESIDGNAGIITLANSLGFDREARESLSRKFIEDIWQLQEMVLGESIEEWRN